MSGTRESGLWRWLAKAKMTLREALHMTRVENLVGQGTPDVEGCLGNQFWMELKCEARPANEDTPIRPKFRPTQVPWLLRRAGAGGKAFVLLQVGMGGRAARYLIPARFARRLEEHGMTEAQLGECSAASPRASAEQVVRAAASS